MSKTAIKYFVLLSLLFTSSVVFGQAPEKHIHNQNRLFVGFEYQFSSHLNAQPGNMNVYQQEASGNNYFSTHAISFA